MPPTFTDSNGAKKPPNASGYVVAVGATATMGLVRFLLSSLFGDVAPFQPFILSVALTAWHGGLRPGLLATALGGVASVLLFTAPDLSARIGHPGVLPGLAIYLVVGTTVCCLCEALHSARRRADQEREAMRVTFASIGDAVVTTDADGNVTYLNAVASEVTGWTPEDAQGKPLETVFTIINEQTRQPVENPVEKVLKAGRVVGLANHTVLIAKDGTERPIADSAAPIRDAAGNVSGVVLVFHDVSESRKAERQVRESAERFEALVTATAQIVWTTDAEGLVVEDSPSWRAFTGQTYGEWKGRGWLDTIHPDDRERTAKVWSEAVAGKTVYQTEYRLRTKDGSYRWTTARGVPLLEAEGRIRQWVGMNADIHDRKQAERAAAEQLKHAKLNAEIGIALGGDATLREMLQACAESLNRNLDGAFARIWTLNQAHAVLELQASAGLYTHLDGPHGRVPVGQFKIGLIAQERTPHLTNTVIGDPRVPEQEWARREGMAAFAGYPMVVEDRLIGVLAMFARQPLSEATLTAMASAARGIALGIERKLMEGRLRQYVADMSDADRRKDEFLATLAHELRNPLAPIRNALLLMKRADGQAAAIEQARAMMERQLAQLIRLVDDLMDVSRITRGKIELRRERVPLSAVVSAAVETSRPLIEEMGHELTVTFSTQPLTVDADPTRLAQVFMNLLTNAAKYSDRAGRIWLTAERQESDVVVSVRDNGIGIAADQLPRIFGMFTQVDRSLEKAQGGLGIGLTLVKRLVEMHGGSIEAKSEGPGKGSEFVVRLPVVVETSVPEQGGARDEPAAPKSSLRILIVDDNRDGADSLAMMLRLMGNDTRTAYDGQQGVDVAEEFRPEVMLLDIGLPKLNGHEACRRIRERPWGKGAVLIAVTGWGQDEDRRRSHEAGFDHHVVKPVDPNDLMRLLAGISNAARK